MSIVVPLVRSLQPPEPDAAILAFSVTPAGDALTLWTSHAGRGQLTARDPSGMFVAANPTRPVDVVVTHDTRHVRKRTWNLTVTTSFPTAHAMPGEGLLILGARAPWRDEAPERNAFLYDRDGNLTRSACLGDGIEHAVTTARGIIFVGYFDEGVFGSRGWGGRGRAPIGASGLNAYGPALELAWSNDTADIVSCYALAGAGEGCVLCPYPGWQVVRFDGHGKAELFSNEVGGASALAAHGDLVALVGGYGANNDRVAVEKLAPAAPGGAAPEARHLGGGRLSLPDGTWRPTHVVGRDGVLHVLAGRDWHAMGVRQIAAALAR